MKKGTVAAAAFVVGAVVVVGVVAFVPPVRAAVLSSMMGPSSNQETQA